MGTEAVPAGADFLFGLDGSAGTLQAFDAGQKLTLASLQQLNVAGVRLAGEQLSAQTLTATRPAPAAAPRSRRAGTGRLFDRAGDRRWKTSPVRRPGRCALATCVCKGLRGMLVLSEAGMLDLAPWSFAGSAAAPDGAATAGPTAEDEAAALPAVRIDSIEIAGENRIRFLDRSVTPNVNVTARRCRRGWKISIPPPGQPRPMRSPSRCSCAPTATSLGAGNAAPFWRPAHPGGTGQLEKWPLPLLAPYMGPQVRVQQGTVSVNGARSTSPTPRQAVDSLRCQRNFGVAELAGNFAGTGLTGSTASLNGKVRIVTDRRSGATADGNCRHAAAPDTAGAISPIPPWRCRSATASCRSFMPSIRPACPPARLSSSTASGTNRQMTVADRSASSTSSPPTLSKCRNCASAGRRRSASPVSTCALRAPWSGRREESRATFPFWRRRVRARRRPAPERADPPAGGGAAR